MASRTEKADLDAWFAELDGSTQSGNGSGGRMQLGYSSGTNNWKQRAAVRFPLNVLTSGLSANDITSCVLRLRVRGAESCFTGGSTPRFWVEKTTSEWVETAHSVLCSVTTTGLAAGRWPGPSVTTVDRVRFDAESQPAANSWIEIDVTALVKAAKAANESEIGLRLISADLTDGYNETLAMRRIAFYTRHVAGSEPELVLEYQQDQSFQRTDVGVGDDTAVGPNVLLQVTDAGVGVDTGQQLQLHQAVDSGTGVDVAVASALVPVADEAVGAESLGNRVFGAADAGVGTDLSGLFAGRILPFPEPIVRGRVSEEFMQAARFGGTIVTRVVLLNDSMEDVDEITGEDGFVVDGSVVMDRTRKGARRTCDLSLSNPGGMWTPRSYRDRLWMAKRFRVETGFQLPSGRLELWPLGVYLIDRPELSLTEADSNLRVQAQDRWKLGSKVKFRRSTHMDVGRRIDSVVYELGALAGYGTEEELYRLDDGGAVLQVEFSWEIGASIPDAMLQIAQVYGLDLFMDRESVLVLRPVAAADGDLAFAATTDSLVTLTPGDDSLLVGITKSLSDELLYNATMVEGASSNRSPAVAEARDMNPLSPAYNPPPGTDPNWPNGGPLGDRLLPPLRSARVLDEAQAQTLANVLLLENTMIEVAYALTIAPLAFLEPYDTVTVEEPVTGTQGVLLLDSLSVPTSESGNQTMQSKELRPLT